MRIFVLIVIFLISNSLCAPDADLVTEMPADYPYNVKSNKMYSGYLTITNKPSKKLHYLFVESQNNPAKDPLVLWFNGGPGCSSLLGFADENGPVYFEENSINMKLNPYSWNKIANVIYIEQPAGVGFSTYGDEEDLYTNDTITAEENLSAIVNWFSKFPEYKGRDFYISGESYAGVYVPYLATNVLEYNLSAVEQINLKGILVGNGLTDWNVDTDPALMDFAYHHGIYSDDIREVYIDMCIKGDKSSEACKNIMKKITDLLIGINIYDIYRNCYLPPTFDVSESRQKLLGFNYTPWINKNLMNNNNKFNGFLTQNLKDTPECADGKGDLWFFNRKDIKKALHVDENITFQLCNDKFKESYDKGKDGSLKLYKRLINENLKIWHYSGDTDGAVPFNGTRAWIHNLNLPIVKSYRQWRVTGEKEKVAGYVEQFEGITFITVMGTGHMVPQWKREEAFHLFQSYLNGEDI